MEILYLITWFTDSEKQTQTEIERGMGGDRQEQIERERWEG